MHGNEALFGVGFMKHTNYKGWFKAYDSPLGIDLHSVEWDRFGFSIGVYCGGFE